MATDANGRFATIGTGRLASGTVASNSDFVLVRCSGAGCVSVSISDTWSGTLEFQSSWDNGTTWRVVKARNAENLSSESTTASANGVWIVSLGAQHLMRVIGKSWVSGAASLLLQVSDATLVLPPVTSVLSGAATEAKQDTGNTSLASIDTKLPDLGQRRASRSLSVVSAAEQLDAFSRLRVSEPLTIFDSQQQYGDNALVWENVFTGTGAVTNLLNESTVQLTTGGTASGASVVRQSRQYLRYQPGKAQLIFLTFACDGGGVTNGRRRAGYFDANDGFYFELDGSALSFVRRSSTSGSPVNTSVPRSSWNLDKLDGTGTSGITLDPADTQILVIDLQWLGVGRVRMGFDIDGQIIYCHEFRHANSLTVVYMKTANLPIRFEVENTGTTAAPVTMRQICSSVISEGGFEKQRALQYAAGRGASALGVTTRRPVLSIRAKATGPNSVRNTGWVVPLAVSIYASTNGCYYELVLNGTLTGAAFAAFSATQSIAEVDTSATAITGGTTLEIGTVAAGASTGAQTISDRFYRDFPLVYSSLLNVQDTITIVCTSISATSNILADITWQEIW